jgi:hypothetical protein
MVFLPVKSSGGPIPPTIGVRNAGVHPGEVQVLSWDSINIVGWCVMNKKPRSMHKTIGDIFKEALRGRPHYGLIRDKACGGKQRVPLFCATEKSRETEYCNVDLLVLKENKIRIVVEIEESNVKPTQICGKFLTSALANYYIHDSERNEPIRMDDSITFIQIVDTSKLVKDKTSKFKQWKALEESIKGIIPLKNSGITSYGLLSTDELDDLTSLIKEMT